MTVRAKTVLRFLGNLRTRRSDTIPYFISSFATYSPLLDYAFCRATGNYEYRKHRPCSRLSHDQRPFLPVPISCFCLHQDQERTEGSLKCPCFLHQWSVAHKQLSLSLRQKHGSRAV